LTSTSLGIPLLGELIPGGTKPGTIFMVEYDPESQWFSFATSITAGVLRSNGYVTYMVFTRSPEEFKYDLSALEVDLEIALNEGRLIVDDWYTASLAGGRIATPIATPGFFERTKGGWKAQSLKVADLSVQWLKESKDVVRAGHESENWPPGALAVGEAVSSLLRFNDEKEVLEWIESRVMPSERKSRRITMWGFTRGIHSEVFYKRLESTCDGVIDLRVMERGDEPKNFFRIRSLKGQPHDAHWHEIEIRQNGEAILKD
jgi:KaiC/GvpD/RAD55 family RecA-like ATPase